MRRIYECVGMQMHHSLLQGLAHGCGSLMRVCNHWRWQTNSEEGWHGMASLLSHLISLKWCLEAVTAKRQIVKWLCKPLQKATLKNSFHRLFHNCGQLWFIVAKETIFKTNKVLRVSSFSILLNLYWTPLIGIFALHTPGILFCDSLLSHIISLK